MLNFRRIINYPGQLNGFVSLLRNTLKTSAGERTSSRLTALRQWNPGANVLMYAWVLPFPVVKAWGPWKKNDDKDKNDKTFGERAKLRLVNKKDNKLKADVQKADELYSTGNTSNFDEAYRILFAHKDLNEPELLWRLGRLLYERSKIAPNAGEKKKLVEEAYGLVFESLELDEKNFATHKWMAILLNELSQMKGIKEQIKETVNVKNHMIRAVELNPDDATSIHLLGHWCFSVADIPWYQRKIAATLFATPPECSFEEAYKHFLRAEYTEPGFYSQNLLMLARCSIKLGDIEKAEEYLIQLKSYKGNNEDDFLAKREGKELRDKLSKSKNYDASKETPSPSEEAKA